MGEAVQLRANAQVGVYSAPRLIEGPILGTQTGEYLGRVIVEVYKVDPAVPRTSPHWTDGLAYQVEVVGLHRFGGHPEARRLRVSARRSPWGTSPRDMHPSSVRKPSD